MSVRKPSNVLPAAFSCSSTAACEPNCLMIWAMYVLFRLFFAFGSVRVGRHLQHILAPNQIVQNRSCQLLRRDRLPRGGGSGLDGIHRLVQLALLDFKTVALDEIGRG